VTINVGIRLQNSDRNTVINNNVTNSGTGLTIYISNNNTIFHNNFSYNDVQISANEWYALTFGHNISVNTISENYYSDYNGTDSDGDGIGDTPYIIDENNQDSNPLVKSTVIPEFPSWTILPLVLTVTLFSVVVKRNIKRV
jgi:parallel beta-helix repeat protein